MRLFSKSYRMKAVDYLNLSRGAGLAIFHKQIGEGLPAKEKELQVEGWESLLTLLHMLCFVTCNADGKPLTAANKRRY
jgi:hypothetical protein